MSEFTAVNANAMQDGIQDLATAHRGLTTALDDLKSELSKSLSQWEGNAQAAYGQVQREWNASGQKMGEIVHKMTTVLTSIASGYQENEKKIQGTWGA